MKRAIIKMTDDFLMSLLKNTFLTDKVSFRVDRGLPSDTRIVRAGYDHTGILHLVLESEEFVDILDGQEYPTLPSPIFTKVYDDRT